MVRMGRPRKTNKDLPTGLYRDGKGRLTLKVFNEEHIRRLGGKTSMSFGRDLVAARTKWAEVYGFRELEAEDGGTLNELFRRFLEEDLVRVVPGKKKVDPPRPKYAPRTQGEYKRQAKILRAQYGEQRYAKSEAQAAQGGYFRTMDVSKHIRDLEAAGKGPMGNRDAALLGSVFRYAKECGLTEYNPCLGASRHTETPRDREIDDQLFLDLYRHADEVLRVWMDLVHQVGSRISDILRIHDADWSDAGLQAVPGKVKRGHRRRKQLFERTDDLAATIERARKLRKDGLEREARRTGNPKLASIYLLPNVRTGQPYSLSGFESKWDACRMRLAREVLGAAATPEQLRDFVRELDVHMHDGRARAGDDAEKRGVKASDFLGHTNDQTARRHYLNRGVKKLQPNPRIKASG
jgi:hypothetical protein